MIELVGDERGTLVPVRAHPGGKRDAVLGERSGALRISVSAPPERGKANAAIIEVLAEALGCKRSQIELVSGETARDKRFLIAGVVAETIRDRIAALSR